MIIPLIDRILYEDNHLIAVNKECGELVQGDKTGDLCLLDEVKKYLKEKYNKSGNVFLGLPHRLDRPTSGVVLFCKTSKALERMNTLFREGKVDKTYLAVCDGALQPPEGRLEHWIIKNEKTNTSKAFKEQKNNSKLAILEYKTLGASARYFLLQIHLLTGRHHQIRAQLAACNIHIKGDLKYGFPRSNPDGGICLHAYSLSFIHPVSGKSVEIKAEPLQAIFQTLFSDALKQEESK